MILMLNIVFLPFLSTTANAAGEFSVIEVYDPQGLITRPLHYDSATDAVSLTIFGTKAVKVDYVSYGDDSTFTNPKTTKTLTAAQYGWSFFDGMAFNCNIYYLGTLYDASNNVLVRVKVHITGLKNPVCDAESAGEGSGSGECNSCAIFSCPGWGQYMGKLDDIKAAIPPPPNWNQVAGIFRDTIAPQIKKDMAELIGTAPNPTMPTLPKAPDKPNAPPLPEDLDDRNIKAPTGKEDPDLGDSGFTPEDLKSAAPDIPVRDDPTEGFNINNPIDALPSQEDFKKNVPNEGDAPYPGKPKEPENVAPTPNEQPNKAPTPTEQPNKAPTPTEQPNTAPTPGENHGNPPIPGSDSGKVPIPGGDYGTGPIPGSDNTKIPIPGSGDEKSTFPRG